MKVTAMIAATLVAIAAAKHKEGEKCMGAPGFPPVEYLGCEEGLECIGDASDWGKVCVKSTATSCRKVRDGEARKYTEGEKCRGASGYPAIPYFGCADGLECTGDAPDWGKICVKVGGQRRYKEGEKCRGAQGHPAVPYRGCADGLECTGDASDWGKICVEVGSDNASHATTTVAVSSTRFPPPTQTQPTQTLSNNNQDQGGQSSGLNGNCYLGYSRTHHRPPCFWHNCYGYCRWLGALGHSISYNNWVYQKNYYLGFNHQRSDAFWDVCKSNCRYF